MAQAVVELFGFLFFFLSAVSLAVPTKTRNKEHAVVQKGHVKRQSMRENLARRSGSTRELDRAGSRSLLRRKLELNQFNAFQECPRCGALDCHWIKSIHKYRSNQDHPYLIRECKYCQLTWEQW